MESILFEELEDFCKEHNLPCMSEITYDYQELTIDCRRIPEIRDIIHVYGFEVSLGGVRALYFIDCYDRKHYTSMNTKLFTTLLSL